MWQSEPDKVQWTDKATGFTCLAVRHHSLGHWCGYVGVPEGHSLYGVDYSQTDTYWDVHGGLTFAGPCQENREHGICHIPEPGQTDKVWWLGFDCAHAGDMSPGMARLRYLTLPLAPEDQYRSLEYVQKECRNLAAQFAAGVPSLATA